jgi:hypothetical protein
MQNRDWSMIPQNLVSHTLQAYIVSSMVNLFITHVYETCLKMDFSRSPHTPVVWSEFIGTQILLLLYTVHIGYTANIVKVLNFVVGHVLM